MSFEYMVAHATIICLFYVTPQQSCEEFSRLKLSTKLINARGDWGILAPVAQAWLGLDDASTGVGYSNLIAWNSGITELPITLDQGTAVRMSLYLKIPVDADNTIASKWVSTDWEIYGTQVTP